MAAENSPSQTTGSQVDDRLIGRLASSSTYDEAFLACTDGYCIFDRDLVLVAYSDRLANLYPTIRNDIKLGISYNDYLRFFIEKGAVRNIETADDTEAWINEQVKSGAHRGTYVHHLLDGRWMQISAFGTSSGELLFTALDITHLQQQREKLRESKRKFQDFARLSSDWFWELDENLCYSFYSMGDTTNDAASNSLVDEWLGKSRPSLLLQHVAHDDQLHLHLGQLQRHEPVDVILEWKLAPFEGVFGHVQAEPQFDADGNFTGYIGCGRDVSNEVRLKKLLKFQAEHDDLTGLKNRRSFEETLKSTILSLHYDWKPKTLAYIDLDRFKQVNDGSGHNAGDELLKHVARLLEETLLPDAVIARVGGDEFAVIFNLDLQQSKDRIELFIEKISNFEFHWYDKLHTIGASVGLTGINDIQSDPSDLIVQADSACYVAKDAGRNQARVFDRKAVNLTLEVNQTEQIHRLREVLRHNELALLFQPVKPTSDNKSQHWFEVLVSLELFTDKLMPARQLVPLAEKNGLSVELDKCVVSNAFKHAAAFVESGHDVFLTVNLSAHSLNDNSFLDYMDDVLKKNQALSRNLGFEFNESSAHENLDTLAEFVKINRKRGYRFVLDNFGNQNSSFEFLYKLPIDLLKIDANVVNNLGNSNASQIIISAFIEMSRELGIKTVAEYVEDAQTEAFLKRAGVDYLQGFGIAEPRLAEQWLQDFRDGQLLPERRAS